MAEVVWSDPALHELVEIRAYVTLFDPSAAERIVTKLISLGDSLANFPDRGRQAPDGTRELVTVPPYVLRYEVKANLVTILRVRHGRRQPRK